MDRKDSRAIWFYLAEQKWADGWIKWTGMLASYLATAKGG